MWLILFRAFVVVLLAHAGYVYSPFPKEPALGLLLGLGTAVGLIALEHKMRNVSGPHLVGALVGGVTGLFAARLAWGALAGLDIVGGDFVYVVAQDKDSKARAQQRPVQVEALAGDEVVIRDGLVVGEQVATSGSFKLRDEVLVSVVAKPESIAANSGAGAHAAL